ncbi:MAG: methyltransferase [Actinobacteria bacterium]|nr:methyltransferase [Actinomycetota bacterium]
MTSRERVSMALNHKEPDRVPVDFGGSVVTGIHASALHRLRKTLNLKDNVVKVYEPMMMLGLVEDDVIRAIGGDVIGLNSPSTLLGYRNENWKPWRLPDGTDVLIGEGFTFKNGSDGAIYAYPNGNTSVPPSAKMPKNGLYFDNIIRQENLANHEFNARKDYADQYTIFNEADCYYFDQTSKFLYEETDYAIFGNFFLGGVGDVFHVPGAWIEHPKGIRDIQDWITAHYDHPDYVKEFFEMQKEVVLKNFELYRQAVGDRISVIAISGTDFGTQIGPFISPDTYREFYKPYHKIFNEWVHKNTNWKVFFHSCGSIIDFIDDFIEVGVDIINPVQFSAFGMDLETLKSKYGSKIVFWGGGINPQTTLPFGTTEEVIQETRKNVSILAKGGGFVCAGVHNIQAPTPVENIISFFKAINN